jgi:hypothetical protein
MAVSARARNQTRPCCGFEKKIRVLGPRVRRAAPHRIDNYFFIRVPFGRFINPITKTDWECTGVEPDVKVAATDALDEALRRARSGP